MSQGPAEQKPVNRTSSFKMIRTLAGVALMSGILIVFTDAVTEARIQYNEDQALAEAVIAVLPGAVEQRTMAYIEGEGFVPVDEAPAEAPVVYAGYDEADQLVGVAIKALGQGYAGPIQGIFGYSPEEDAIIGFRILSSKETPGLGDRVGKDPEFLANFKGLSADVAPNGSELVHTIQFVKSGEKTEPWQIDGISGATISSKAVANMVNESAQAFIPLIKRHFEEVE
jgi:electron transport complex protein RnfG